MGGTLIICSMCINLLNTFTIVEKNFDDFSLLSFVIFNEKNQSRRKIINVYIVELMKKKELELLSLHARLNRSRSNSSSGLSTCMTSNGASSQLEGCHSDKTEYPFYYSIQQDTTSTRSCASQNNSVSLTNFDSAFEKEKLLLLNESPLNKQLYALKSPHHHHATLSTTSYTSNQIQYPSLASQSICNENHLNLIYENILQTLPPHTDLRYFAVSILNNKGCRLEIPNTGVSLIIPENAVLLDDDHLIYIALINIENQMPTLHPGQTRLSPVVLIGPSDITLLKPAVLAFEHTAILETSWKFNLMFSEDVYHWKSILTYGQENISTPVYLQFNNQQQAFVLVRMMMFAFLAYS